MALLCILYYVNAPWQYDSVIFHNIVSWTRVKINGLLVPKTLVRVISYCYTPYIVCETLVIVVAQYHKFFLFTLSCLIFIDSQRPVQTHKVH
jgi:hypothetical protein